MIANVSNGGVGGRDMVGKGVAGRDSVVATASTGEGLRSFAVSKAAGASCAVAGALEPLVKVVGALVMDSRTELSNVRDLMR